MNLTNEIIKLHGFNEIGEHCFRQKNITIFKVGTGYDVQIDGCYKCNIQLENELIELKGLINEG